MAHINVSRKSKNNTEVRLWKERDNYFIVLMIWIDMESHCLTDGGA